MIVLKFKNLDKLTILIRAAMIGTEYYQAFLSNLYNVFLRDEYLCLYTLLDSQGDIHST